MKNELIYIALFTEVVLLAPQLCYGQSYSPGNGQSCEPQPQLVKYCEMPCTSHLNTDVRECDIVLHILNLNGVEIKKTTLADNIKESDAVNIMTNSYSCR